MARSGHISIQDIAQQLNAPIEAINKVILGHPDVSEDLRHKVFLALEDAGIVRVSRGTTETTIGVAIPGTVIGDYIGDVVSGIRQALQRRGASLMLYVERTSDDDDLLDMIGPNGCDGIIAIVPDEYERLLSLCHEYERPHVLVDYQGEEQLAGAMTVEVNNWQSIISVMHHLFDLEHKRIGFITGRMEHASARMRLKGYYDALEAMGIGRDEALVREGTWFHESGYEQGMALLALDQPPTAIVASNDLMAFGVMQAAREAGVRMSTDLSVTGFDDIAMASAVSPALTTVRQPAYAMGEAAVDLLFQRVVDKRDADPHVQLETQLIVRQSTGRARK